MKKNSLLGVEHMLARLSEIAHISPKQVREMLSAQIDMLALCANDAALQAFETIKSEDATLEAQAAAMKVLGALGFFTDSVSRQRVALFREVSGLNPGEGDQRPQLMAPGEVPNAQWEEKYSDQAALTIAPVLVKPQ